jgi:hypothetical protein
VLVIPPIRRCERFGLRSYCSSPGDQLQHKHILQCCRGPHKWKMGSIDHEVLHASTWIWCLPAELWINPAHVLFYFKLTFSVSFTLSSTVGLKLYNLLAVQKHKHKLGNRTCQYCVQVGASGNISSNCKPAKMYET